jgi:hypothetical protein
MPATPRKIWHDILCESGEVRNRRRMGRVAAEQAVARRVGATPDVKVEAKGPVLHGKFVEMRVSEGEISQWM